MRKALLWVAALATIGGGAAGLYVFKPMAEMGVTMAELVQENQRLRSALDNLSQVEAIGYAKVVDQNTVKGFTTTTIKFVATDPDDPTEVQLEQIHQVKGEVVYFDLLIVNFSDELVRDGDRSALYLWRRIFGSRDTPEDGLVIEPPGSQPERYAEINRALDLDERAVFWDEIWTLANNPNRLKHLGITAVEGKAAYRRVEPGLIYTFNLKADGEIETLITPDL